MLFLGITLVLAIVEIISIRRIAFLRFCFALIGSIGALFFVSSHWLKGGSFQLGVLGMDRYSLLFALVILGQALLFACQVRGGGEKTQEKTYSLLFLSALGALVTVHAQNLVALYLGIEMTWLPLIVWFGEGQTSWRLKEVTTKAYLIGGLASVFLLCGVAFIYAGGHDASLAQVFAASSEESFTSLKLLGLVFFLSGLAIKMAWVPFHFYQSDIYQGGHSVAIGFWGILSKLIGVLVLSRMIAATISHVDFLWLKLLGIAAVLVIIIGPLQALQQSSLKRRLAYMSIGHTGFLLLGLAVVGSGTGIQEKAFAATIFYLFAYAIMFSGVSATVVVVSRHGDEPTEMSELCGLAKTMPWLAAAFSFFLLGLAGIPATIGFFGNFYIIRIALDGGLLIFAIFVLIGWALLIYNSIQMITTFYFKPTRGCNVVRSGYPLIAAIFVCALLTLYWGFFPSTVLQIIHESVRALLF